MTAELEEKYRRVSSENEALREALAIATPHVPDQEREHMTRLLDGKPQVDEGIDSDLLHRIARGVQRSSLSFDRHEIFDNRGFSGLTPEYQRTGRVELILDEMTYRALMTLREIA